MTAKSSKQRREQPPAKFLGRKMRPPRTPEDLARAIFAQADRRRRPPRR